MIFNYIPCSFFDSIEAGCQTAKWSEGAMGSIGGSGEYCHIRILRAHAQSFIGPQGWSPADLAIGERRTAICGCNAGCSAITQEPVSIRLLQCLSLPLIGLC